MITEFFVLGGVMFWLAVAILSIAFVALVEYDEGWPLALGILTVVVGAAFFLSPLGPAMWKHPWWSLAVIPGWVTCGVGWTFFKWTRLMAALRSRLKRAIAEFGKEHNLSVKFPIGAVDRPKFADWLMRSAYDLRRYGLRLDTDTGLMDLPGFYYNRDRLITWAVLWPWSIIWTIIREMFFELIEWFVDSFRKSYEAITNWFFKDFT